MNLTPVDCEDNGSAGHHELRGQSCSRTYALLPAHTATAEDFMVYWIQMELDPGRGWCATHLSFEVALSEGRIVSATPHKSQRIKTTEVTTTQLAVDADGSAPVPGLISNEVQVAKGKTTVARTDRAYRFTWTGNSKAKVVIAIGIEIAYERTPPRLFTSSSWGEGWGGSSCRANVAPVVDGRRS